MVTLLENTVPGQQKPFTNLDQIQQIILARRIDGNGEKWKYCMSVFWNYQSLFSPLTKMLKNVGEKKKGKRSNNCNKSIRETWVWSGVAKLGYSGTHLKSWCP